MFLWAVFFAVMGFFALLAAPVYAVLALVWWGERVTDWYRGRLAARKQARL